MANIEKRKSPESEVYEEPVTDSIVDIDVDEDVSVDDNDEDSWTFSDEEDEQESDEDSDVEADDEQAEYVEAQPQKKPSKDERKIQALKNEAKRLQKEKLELQRKLESKFDADATEELQKKYVSAGYDEEEAKVKAKEEVRQNRLEERLEQLEFKDTNYTVFQKYPKAVAEMSKVMRAVKASGMTVEQVCRGLYGAPVPEAERRAKAAVTGELGGNTPSDNVANATRSSKPVPKTTLSDKEIRAKREIEKMYNGGKQMSDADFVAIYRK